MTRRVLFQAAVWALTLSSIPMGVKAQGCTNTTEYPLDVTIAPNSLGTVTQISSCSYLQEYSVVGPVLAGATYNFTCTGGAYITVHEGSADGPVIANGYSPLDATATLAGNLYAHWNVDSLCGTATGCQTTTVQLLLNCTPPTVTVVPVDDCDNNQFSLIVNIANLGDATDLDLVYGLSGGTADTLSGLIVGLDTLGPFTVGQTVNLTAMHSSDPLCNVNFTGLASGNTCPTIIQCGDAPLDQAYCYINDDDNHWHYESATGGALILIFSAGSIESSNYDHIKFYDGIPGMPGVNLIWENTLPYPGTDLTGLQVISPTGHIYMTNTSEGGGSCDDGSYNEWIWQVGCLDCQPAIATYNVVTDCDNFQYTVEVHITDLGSDATLDISADDLGTILATATDTGVYTVGPFTANIPVTITLQNSDNSLCNVHSSPLVNPLCPTIIECGGVPLDEAYCYTNGDAHIWHWESSTGGALIMIFSAGLIESNLYDHIRIYDGIPGEPGINLLWENTLPYPGTNLNDLHVVSATGHLYMASTSDGSNSCDDGAYQEWIWQVGCLDCQPATATYNVVTDCDNFQYTVEVNITDLGSDASLDITADSLGTVLATATAPGTYTVGPFTANIPVVITLQNSDNSLCNVHSALLVNPLCPQILTCGDPAVETLYCYGLNDVHAWHWQADSPTDSLSLLFLAGSIQAAYSPTDGDHLRIYDGPDNTSPLLFDHVVTDLFNLTDLQVFSSGPDIYMEMNSDNYGSCSSGATAEWDWLVGCANCSAPAATYAVVTDCDNFQFSVDVDITAMGSNPVINITNTGGAPPIAATAVGTYTVGPFTANQPVVVNLGDDANLLCSIHSAPLLNPLCPTTVNCGVDTLHETYCYNDYDSHTWHWQSSAAQPLFMLFSAGTIENSSYDHLTIYNGPDDQSPILFDHVMTTQEDLTGLQVIASSGHIYMKMSSDGSSSCSGGGQTQWAWDINCLDCTNPVADFSMTEDCLHHSFNVVVNVNDLGSGSSVRITNSLNTDTLMNVPLGITNVGPFRMDTTVTVTVLNETNPYCQVVSPVFTYTSTACIDSVCEIQLYDYCYANADTAWFMYQGTGSGPITIRFLSGQLLPNDRIQIYNGFDPSIPPLYQGNVGGSLAGFALNTTTAAHQLLLRVASDASGSCATGQATPMSWTVSCGAVGIEEQTQSDFSMYPNPTTGQLSIQLPLMVKGNTDMRILDLAGRIVYKETFNANGGVNTFDLKSLQSGNYTVVLSTKDWVKTQLLQIMR